MYVQVKEVELGSLAHVKRIKELEEQLHGAQNIMASLKVELHQAHNELEQTRKTLVEARIMAFLYARKLILIKTPALVLRYINKEKIYC